MRIVDVRAKTVRIVTDLWNARGTRAQSTVTIVAAITDVVRNSKPVIGFSFSGTGFPAPTAQLQERFIPRLLSAGPDEAVIDPEAFDPGAMLKYLTKGEKFGGDAERSTAVGTLEVAIWDAVAKIAQVPAYVLMAHRYGGGEVLRRMECYVGGGWYSPTKTVDDLRTEVSRYLDLGYRTVKVKIGGLPINDDLKRLDAVLDLVGDPSRLAVDANSGIAPERRREIARAVKPYRLRWFEEPAHPNDYKGNAEFIADYDNPVATGENQFSIQELENLVLYGGMRPDRDILQWDIPHCYGIEAADQILKMLAGYGWSRKSIGPHGGNQISLNACAAFGLPTCEAYPEAFGAFSGYADGLTVEDGYLTIGEWEGMGFEHQEKLFAEMKTLVPDHLP